FGTTLQSDGHGSGPRDAARDWAMLRIAVRRGAARSPLGANDISRAGAERPGATRFLHELSAAHAMRSIAENVTSKRASLRDAMRRGAALSLSESGPQKFPMCSP